MISKKEHESLALVRMKKHGPGFAWRLGHWPRRSKHNLKSHVAQIEVWTQTIGDAGIRYEGWAQIGVHRFRTNEAHLTETGARIAALGRIMSHIACVHVRHGDGETGQPAKPWHG